MMKRGLFSLLAVLFSVCVLAAEEAPQVISDLAVGGTRMIDTPFAVNTVDVVNKRVAEVVIQDEGRHLQVNGKAVGTTDISAFGANGRNWKITVTVTDRQDESLKSLKRDLEDGIPGLDAVIENGKLKITGKIKTIAKVKQKNKIINAYKMKNLVIDMTSFQASPEVMLRLKKSLENAGFNVVENQSDVESGTLSIIQDMDSDIIRIKGKVYNEAQRTRVKELLDAEPWLKTKSASSKESDDLDEYKITCQMDVDVENITLQVDILHIGLTKADCKNIGLDWENLLSQSFNFTVELSKSFAHTTEHVTGAQRKDSYTRSTEKELGMEETTITAVLGLMARNNVNRVRRSGFLTLKSNGSDKPSKLHQGSTVWLQAPSTTTNNNVSELKEVEYGLILEAKGGMTGQGKVKIDLIQTVSYPIPVEQGSNVTYELKKSNTETTVECGLGEAIAIGGVRETAIKNNTSGSIPYIRNVPVLRWLVAQDRDEFTDMQILTLVSVRRMDGTTSIDPINEQLFKMKQEDDAEYAKALAAPEKAEQHEKRKWYQFWRP